MTSTVPALAHAPSFLCDAMLGGLARWLRAVGYAAAFEPFGEDGALVRRAVASGEVLLSSDAPLFERKLVRSGEARALFVPRHAPPLEQTAFVLGALALPVREPRCMGCGGELACVAKTDVAAVVPPRAFAHHERFFRCRACSKVFWHGTHWSRIQAERATLATAARAASV